MKENSFVGFGCFITILLSVLPGVKTFGQERFMHLDSRQGLSHNNVKAIYRDKTGFVWIGTESGLNRFDGYSVKIYRNDPADSSSLPNDYVARVVEAPNGALGIVTGSGVCFYDPATEKFSTDLRFLEKKSNINSADVTNIVRDNAGNYWFFLLNKGLLLYNEEKKSTLSLQHVDNDNTTISTNNITSLKHHPDGSYWIAHSNGLVENFVLSKEKIKVVKRLSFLQSLPIADRSLSCELMIDKDGDLWFCVNNADEGVFYYNTDQDKIYHFRKNSSPVALSSDLTAGLVQDDEGYIWIASNGGGIDIFDKKNFSIKNLSHDPDSETTLNANSASIIYKDQEGIIWIGTFKKGLNFFHKNMNRFPVYNRHSKPYSLPFEDVNHFVEDSKGNLWLGTNGGGLIYFDRKSGRFTTYKHNPKDPHSLSSDVIVNLCLDHEGKLWIGTYYGGLNCFDGKRFIRYLHRAEDPRSFPDKSAWEIYEDSKHQLWIGTLAGGLSLFDRKTKTFIRYSHPQQRALISAYTSTIREDRRGNLWFGTSIGIDVLMKDSGNIVHFESEKNNPTSLVDNIILGMLEDSKGRMWIGTIRGLSVWQKETNRFTNFTEKNGLPHNTIMAMEEDAEGRIWISTSNGLACATILSKNDSIQLRVINYSEADGLQGQHFNENASARLRTGELVFGGDNGFNIFKPGDMGHDKIKPRLVFTDFQLFNKSVRPGRIDADNHFSLSSSITTNPSIVLAASDNVFSIEFAALNFTQPSKTKYKYKLEGFNDDWLLADANNRRVAFTNLDAGNYTFRVIATNSDNAWNEEGISLAVTVLPPFWKSKKAFVIYMLIMVAALYATRKLIQQGERMKFAIKQQQEEAMRSRELDMMKTKFFTNVSHEFRTPLSLIVSPLEKLSGQVKDDDQRKNIDLIQRNTKRLLNLVNQLLDFRKMEVHDIRYHPSGGDIIQFVRETVYSFADLSEKKNIKLKFESNTSSLEAIFDHDKVEKILFNLLSNAFKFTMGNGSISVIVDVKDSSESSTIQIIVKDSGIGIPPEKHELIFERFFQNELPSSLVNQGSGIGLAITKEFVRIHGGTIRVESEAGKGSSFIVELPLKKLANSVQETVSESMNGVVDNQNENDAASGDKPLILLVEDNEDFRFYLKDNLKVSYSVIEAETGEEGWKKTISQYPDLIVTDVMMPDLTGTELCKRIKSDQRVSHIPVILLTARSGEEQRLEGFEVGADDYIPKPFSFPILESRIRNLISLRKDLHRLLAKKNGIKASEIQITSLDEQFISRVIAAIEKNIANSELTVLDLSRELGVSRAQFFRKVQELTGKAPLELIRSIRLQHAAQLLEKSQLSVSEIAYRVGFNNPKYFARHFKEQYHVLPSAYANGKRRT